MLGQEVLAKTKIKSEFQNSGKKIPENFLIPQVFGINNHKSQVLMNLLQSPQDYLFNLQTTSKSDAKRLWRKQIKESWNHKCAYCDSEDNLTLDHILPQCKGGLDITRNVVSCCHSCNQSKGHEQWKLWYVQQNFYNEDNYDRIEEWMKPPALTNLYKYRPRRNNAS